MLVIKVSCTVYCLQHLQTQITNCIGKAIKFAALLNAWHYQLRAMFY